MHIHFKICEGKPNGQGSVKATHTREITDIPKREPRENPLKGEEVEGVESNMKVVAQITTIERKG